MRRNHTVTIIATFGPARSSLALVRAQSGSGADPRQPELRFRIAGTANLPKMAEPRGVLTAGPERRA
jgi:hypothetical protein